MILLYNKNTLLDRLPNLKGIAFRVSTRSDSVGTTTIYITTLVGLQPRSVIFQRNLPKEISARKTAKINHTTPSRSRRDKRRVLCLKYFSFLFFSFNFKL